jgi:integrase/recombinase XerD
LPVHHTLEGYLDRYLQTAGIGEDKKGWLFRSALGKTGQLSVMPST